MRPAEDGGPGTEVVAPGVVALTGLGRLPAEEGRAVVLVAAAVEAAFAAGRHRVEAEIDPDDVRVRRVLQRAGLRPEGRARGRGLDGAGGPVDRLRLARLADDPWPGSREAFLGMLDATLPLKRVIVQGLVSDGAGRLLLCELTYKKDWDLVGGVAEPGESPVDSLLREVREELGVDLPVGELLAVDWLPPYRQWRDAILLVFDLGAHPDLDARAVLQPTEVAALHWVGVEEAEGHVAPYVLRLLRSLREAHAAEGQAHAAGPAGTVFLEDGVLRGVRAGAWPASRPARS